MQRDGYFAPLNDVPVKELERRLRGATEAAIAHFPRRTGVIVFAFDFDGGGCAYMSNGERADCIKMLEEWIAYQRSLC